MALARSSYARGEDRRAAGVVGDAMALFDQRNHPTSRARVVALKGRLASAAGDHATARACAEAALERLDRLGERQGQAYARGLGLGAQSAFDRGDRLDAPRGTSAHCSPPTPSPWGLRTGPRAMQRSGLARSNGGAQRRG